MGPPYMGPPLGFTEEAKCAELRSRSVEVSRVHHLPIYFDLLCLLSGSVKGPKCGSFKKTGALIRNPQCNYDGDPHFIEAAICHADGFG